MNFLILFLHITLTIILCLLLFYSLYQRCSYQFSDAVLICSKSLDQCLLSFLYHDEKRDYILPYSTVGIDGTFKTEVAYQENEEGPVDFIIIGGKNQIFYGTPFKISLYIILLFLSISLFFISKKSRST